MMRRSNRSVYLGVLILGCTFGGRASLAAGRTTVADHPALPAEVVDFVLRSVGCRNVASAPHFDSAVRPESVDAELARMRCAELPAEKTRLVQKYRQHPDILQALDP